MNAEKLLKELPSVNPANFSKFKSDSGKSSNKKLTVYLSTEEKPSEQVIVSDRSSILLRYLYLQLDKKLNGEAEKRKPPTYQDMDGKGDNESTSDNEATASENAAPFEGPPRKQARLASNRKGT